MALAPYELEDLTLKTLRATRAGMLSEEFQLTLLLKPAAERKAAALLLSDVQVTILKLEALELAAIRDDLVANADELEAGAKDLKAKLENLEQVQEVVAATAQFLAIVARIAALAA